MKLLAIDIAEFDEAEAARTERKARDCAVVTEARRAARAGAGAALPSTRSIGGGAGSDDEDDSRTPVVPVDAPADVPLGFGKAFMAMLPHDVMSESAGYAQTGFGLTHKWEKRRKERRAALHESAEAAMVAAGGAGLASTARTVGSAAAAAEALSVPRAAPRPGGGGGDGADVEAGAGGAPAPARLAPPRALASGVASSRSRLSKFASEGGSAQGGGGAPGGDRGSPTLARPAGL
jgi:hypothetical protein